MIETHLATNKQYQLPFSKKSRYIAGGIILGLCLFYLFRSCTLDHLYEINYTIGLTQWNELQLMGKERNFSAFNNQLWKDFAKQENFRIHLLISDNPLRDLEQKKVDGILTNLQPSFLNEKHLIYSEPYFFTGPVLIISTTPIAEEYVTRKRIIGIPSNSPLILSLEEDPAIQIKIYNDILPALSDLREKKIDGAIFPAIPAYTYIQSFYRQELKIATLPLSDEGVRLVTAKNEKGETLIKKFNEQLAILKQNGTYHQMLEHWGIIDVESIPKK